MSIPDRLRQQVYERAGYRCEYCKLSVRLTGIPLVVEHIQPRSLGGSDNPENLAAACYRCNEFKGAKTHETDEETGQIAPLFNPRTQRWSEHFAWFNGGVQVIGVTPTGNATVLVLHLNNETIVEARAAWVEVGWHPPMEEE